MSGPGILYRKFNPKLKINPKLRMSQHCAIDRIGDFIELLAGHPG